jgi:hypothetical protein
MLPALTLPASLAVLLETFRSCFTAPTFGTFQALVAGLVAQTGRRTVCGMLLGAGLSRLLPHDRFHRFFSRAVWSADELGLGAARLIVTRLLPAAAEIEVAVDDSLFRRRGRTVHGAFWTHDGSQPGNVTARGNRWVICGIVVRLPFSSRRWCLPVLFGSGQVRAPPATWRWPARCSAAGRCLPRPGHPSGRRCRLPRQAVCRPASPGHRHLSAAPQRRPVRAGTAAYRPAWPAPH